MSDRSDRDALLAILHKAGIEIDNEEIERLYRNKTYYRDGIERSRSSDHNFVIFPCGSLFSIEFLFNDDESLKSIEAYE